MHQYTHQLWRTGSIALLYLANTIPTQAQITPDTTLGDESSIVTPNVIINGLPGDRIDGGAIRGTNLFHSFQEFSVNNGRSASFANPVGIENILSRVTGDNPSNILGTLNVSGGNANLFLLNPSGIIFGKNASLDIRGSFVASTASNLNFADGTQFSANASQTNPLLTLSVPIGLQFGATAGSIRNQSTVTDIYGVPVGLKVQPGKTLALVGGNVALEGGYLTAEAGRVELGSVGGFSLVTLTPIDQGLVLGYEGVQNFQDIQLSQEAFVNANGAGGGNIQVRGRSVTLTEGSGIEASTFGSEPGGTLAVIASESVELIGTSDRFPASLVAAAREGTGTGGNLTIEAGRLIIQDGAEALTSTQSEGKAGNLTVRASAVELVGTSAEGSPSGLFATAREESTLPVLPDTSAQIGGNLTIETGQLIVRDGAQVAVATFSARNAGNLTVRASKVRLLGSALSPLNPTGLSLSGLFAGTEPGSQGTGGNLTIETSRLIIQDGAQAQASTLGEGDAGSLIVRASESVDLIGRTPDGRSSGLLAVSGREGVFTEAQGQRGDLRIETGQLTVMDRAEVTVSSTSTASDARGAGNIDITAQTIRLENQGAIAAETASGNGGNIALHNPGLLLLRHQSNISTSAGTAGAGGSGGNINIDNAQLIVAIPAENSDIKANAFLGQGGEVTINAQSIFGLAERNLEDIQTLVNTNDPTQLDPINLSSSDITAISQTDPSLSGQVTINTPDVDPSRGLVILPTDLIDASGLIAQGCASDAEAIARNVFIITGRGGLPPSPTETLKGESVLTNWVTLEPQFEQRSSAAPATNTTGVTVPNQIVEAQGWAIAADGQVILTASAPITSNSPQLTPTSCHSSSSFDAEVLPTD